jgi:hypothetical protein
MCYTWVGTGLKGVLDNPKNLFWTNALAYCDSMSVTNKYECVWVYGGGGVCVCVCGGGGVCVCVEQLCLKKLKLCVCCLWYVCVCVCVCVCNTYLCHRKLKLRVFVCVTLLFYNT